MALDDRPGWDEWAIGVAQAVARRGDCTRSKVGAIILDRSHLVVGLGYNGTRQRRVAGCLEGACPRGKLTYVEQPTGIDYATTGCIAVHAEHNALGWAIDTGQEDRFPGATCYVTREPCQDCYVLLRSEGLARVVWQTDGFDIQTRNLDV